MADKVYVILKCMFICLQDELETEKSSLSKQVTKLEDKISIFKSSIVSSSFEKMCICSEVMIFVICLQEQLETENSILSKQIGELFLVLYILIRHKNAYKKVLALSLISSLQGLKVVNKKGYIFWAAILTIFCHNRTF